LLDELLTETWRVLLRNKPLLVLLLGSESLLVLRGDDTRRVLLDELPLLPRELRRDPLLDELPLARELLSDLLGILALLLRHPLLDELPGLAGHLLSVARRELPLLDELPLLPRELGLRLRDPLLELRLLLRDLRGETRL
jgi:hypothetical protein